MNFFQAYQYYLIEKEGGDFIKESVRGSIIDEDKAAYKLISSFKYIEVGVDDYEIDDVSLSLVGTDPKWPIIKLAISNGGKHKKWISVFMPSSETVRYETDGVKVRVIADGKPFGYASYGFNPSSRNYIKKDTTISSFTLSGGFMERDEVIGIVSNLSKATEGADKKQNSNKKAFLDNTTGRMLFNDSVKEYFEKNPKVFEKIYKACNNNDADDLYDTFAEIETNLRIKRIVSAKSENLSGNELIKFECGGLEATQFGTFFFSPKFNTLETVSICGKPAFEMNYSKVKTITYRSNYGRGSNSDMEHDKALYDDKSKESIGFEASEKWYIC